MTHVEAGAAPPATIRWSATTELVFHVGVLWQTAYLSEPSKQVVGIWVFLGLVMLPYLLLLFFRQGELADETVARAHLLAALWYLGLALVAVALAAGGYRPPGWIVFLVFMAPGARISLLLIFRRLRDPPSPALPVR
jgi:hypothetical protein